MGRRSDGGAGDELRIERPHETQALTLDDRPPIQEVGQEDP
jgi:hypothetical protein